MVVFLLSWFETTPLLSNYFNFINATMETVVAKDILTDQEILELEVIIWRDCLEENWSPPSAQIQHEGGREKRKRKNQESNQSC